MNIRPNYDSDSSVSERIIMIQQFVTVNDKSRRAGGRFKFSSGSKRDNDHMPGTHNDFGHFIIRKMFNAQYRGSVIKVAGQWQ